MQRLWVCVVALHMAACSSATVTDASGMDAGDAGSLSDASRTDAGSDSGDIDAGNDSGDTDAMVPEPRCGDGVVGLGEVCDDGTDASNDLCARDCQTLRFACTSDVVLATTPTDWSRATQVGSGFEIEALCGAWVLIADRFAPSIRLINAITGTDMRRYALPSAPGTFDMDRDTGLLYVGLPSQPRIARVDLVSGAVTTIEVGGTPTDIAVGNDGIVFVSATPEIVIVDGPAAEVVGNIEDVATMRIAYDRVRDIIVTGVQPSSGDEPLITYRFDPVTRTGSLLENLPGACAGGRHLSVSPVGSHIAYSCEGGNNTPDIGSEVADFDTENLMNRRGAWYINAYPTAAEFSRDASLMLSASVHALKLYDTAQHTQLGAFSEHLDGESYDSAADVALSGGATYGFVLGGWESNGPRNDAYLVMHKL